MLFRKSTADNEPMSADGVETDAWAASVLRDDTGQVRRWMVHGGSMLRVDGQELLWAEARCGVALNVALAAAGAQAFVRSTESTTLRLRLPSQPRAVLQAPPSRPAEATRLASTWQAGMAELELAGEGETVLWIDPVLDLTEPPQKHILVVEDGTGIHEAELETAVADNGDLIAFAQLNPREPGLYKLRSTQAATDWVVQDRWDPQLSARGRGTVQGHLREGTELFVRYAPGSPPILRAVLRRSDRGSVADLLRNGNFEEGITGYPPRGWTVFRPFYKVEPGWPGWSQDDPAEGKSCLKFVRPKSRVSVQSQPMRLLRVGKYVLRFKARSDATAASVSVSGQRGTSARLPIEPSADWREYRAELEAWPGHCTVTIDMGTGGAPDQVLWVDDMEFGYVN